MKVEMLVRVHDNNGYTQGDIITIQPAGHGWGRGDLTGNIVVVTDMDIPCGEDWKVKKRCSSCEHRGVIWDTEKPSVGDIAVVKNTCPAIYHQSVDADYILSLAANGVPELKTNTFRSKRMSKLDLSSLLSADSLSVYEAESKISMVSMEVAADKLAKARKNPVAISIVTAKNG